MSDSGLTRSEHQVLTALTHVWNMYLELPEQHPTHQHEFMTAIHQAQRLVMCRPVQRAEGWVHGRKCE